MRRFKASSFGFNVLPGNVFLLARGVRLRSQGVKPRSPSMFLGKSRKIAGNYRTVYIPGSAQDKTPHTPPPWANFLLEFPININSTYLVYYYYTSWLSRQRGQCDGKRRAMRLSRHVDEICPQPIISLRVPRLDLEKISSENRPRGVCYLACCPEYYTVSSVLGQVERSCVQGTEHWAYWMNSVVYVYSVNCCFQMNMNILCFLAHPV